MAKKKMQKIGVERVEDKDVQDVKLEDKDFIYEELPKEETVTVVCKFPGDYTLILTPKISRMIEDDQGNYIQVYSDHKSVNFKKNYAEVEKKNIPLLRSKEYYGIDFMLMDELTDGLNKNEARSTGFLKELIRRRGDTGIRTDGLVKVSLDPKGL